MSNTHGHDPVGLSPQLRNVLSPSLKLITEVIHCPNHALQVRKGFNGSARPIQVPPYGDWIPDVPPTAMSDLLNLIYQETERPMRLVPSSDGIRIYRRT